MKFRPAVAVRLQNDSLPRAYRGSAYSCETSMVTDRNDRGRNGVAPPVIGSISNAYEFSVHRDFLVVGGRSLFGGPEAHYRKTGSQYAVAVHENADARRI